MDFIFNFHNKIATNNIEIYSDFIVNDNILFIEPSDEIYQFNIIEIKYSIVVHVAIRKLLDKNKG